MIRSWHSATRLLLACLLLIGTVSRVEALTPDVFIRLGQTIVWTVPEGVERIVIGDGDVVDVKVLPGQNRRLLIMAKKPGFTNFLVFPQGGGDVRSYNVEVLSYRRPETIAVRIRALSVAQRDLANLGIDWNDSISFREAPPTSPFRFGLPVRESFFSATINMLLQERRAKLLAQPTLLTMTGQKASFLSGGELPIPLVTQNALSVEWKPFGIRLDVEPRVEGADTIVMRVRSEVSSIDRANGIQSGTLIVPAIASRWTDTFMQVKSGESVVLSGLMSEEEQQTIEKVPLLGQIPILGEFFKTRNQSKEKTELVFILTPSVVTGNGMVRPEATYGKDQ